MSRYIDGFVLPVLKSRLDDYRELAELAATVWKEYGALEYVECVADDVQVGELTSFPRSVLLEEDETVIFAWIIYPSRAARDEINAKVMQDPRLASMDASNVPFDGKRLFWGGFTELLRK